MRLLALFRGPNYVDPNTHQLIVDEQLLSSLADENLKWSQGAKLGEYSQEGPALAYDGKVWAFCAYRGTTDTQLRYTYASHDLKWHRGQPFSQHGVGDYYSDASPALAWFRDRFYCVHRGDNGDQRLWFTSGTLTDGWSKDTPLSETGVGDYYSYAGPALAVYKDQLYCVHRGYSEIFSKNDDERLWFTSTTDGVHWEKDVPFNGPSFSATSPALAVFHDRLYCVYRGTDTDELRWTWFDGVQWVPDNKITGHYSYAGPALTVLTRVSDGADWLVCLHRGAGPDVGGDQNLQYTTGLFKEGNLLWSKDNDALRGILRSVASPTLISLDF